MLASKIHQYQRSNLRRILRKKNCNESWCKSSNSRSMETSEESICCQKQKEVLEDIAPYSILPDEIHKRKGIERAPYNVVL